MLHILFLILKIIGIIIAAILGILVLFLCIILFVPVRYEIQGKCDGTLESLKGKITITWLLHLFRVDVLYKDKKAKWKVRIAWKKILGGVGKTSSDKKPNSKVDKDVSEKDIEITDTDNTEFSADDINEIMDALTEPEEGECQDEQKEKTIQLAEGVEEAQAEIPVHQGSSQKQEEVQKDDEKAESYSEKIENWIKKIKCTFQSICDKMKKMQEQKEKVTAFIKNEQHKKAFTQAKKAIFTLLRRWKPGKINAQVIYGFDDPYITGQVLAGLAVLYPFMGDAVEITPDFEHQILKGKLYIKGHIRICHLAGQALKLLLSRAVWKTYKDIRKFEW